MKNADRELFENIEQALKPFDGALQKEIDRISYSQVGIPYGASDFAMLINSMRKDHSVTFDFGGGNYTPSEIFKESLVILKQDIDIIEDKIAHYESIIPTLSALSANPEAAKDIKPESPLYNYLISGTNAIYSRLCYAINDTIEDAYKLRDSIDDLLDWAGSRNDDSTFRFMTSLMSEDNVALFQGLMDTFKEDVEHITQLADSKKESLLYPLIDKVCDELDKGFTDTVAYLQKNDDAFQMMNLKLHDASFYAYKDLENDYPALYKATIDDETDLFYRFVEDSYDQFEEWIKENFKGKEFRDFTIPVGRTSSFYLGDNNVEHSNRYGDGGKILVESTLENLLDEEYGYYNCGFPLTEEGKIDRQKFYDDFRTYMEESFDEIVYVASGEFKEAVEYRYEDAVKIYDYIKDFKENQVKYFKSWLDFENEMMNDQIIENDDTERE